MIAYSINCVGCSIGVMIALILLGLSSLSWMVLASALVFLYKVVSMPRWVDVALAGGMIAAGLLLAIQA